MFFWGTEGQAKSNGAKSDPSCPFPPENMKDLEVPIYSLAQKPNQVPEADKTPSDILKKDLFLRMRQHSLG